MSILGGNTSLELLKQIDDLKKGLEELENRNQGLGDLKLIKFNSTQNQIIKIKEYWDPFVQVLFMQGSLAVACGTYVLSGYGAGTSLRYHIGNIITSKEVIISINDEEHANEFIINNQTNSILNCTLMIISGSTPNIVQGGQ